MRTDTEATIQYWMDQARHNLNAADDFKAELKVARREIRKLEVERELADRLAGVLELYFTDDAIAHHAGIADAIAAWKEARHD